MVDTKNTDFQLELQFSPNNLSQKENKSMSSPKAI